MSNLLYRLGYWCTNNSKKVLSGWVLFIVILVVSVLTFKPSFSEDMSIPGTPSEKTMDIITEEFGEAEDTGTGRIIFSAEAEEALWSEAAQEKINESIKAVSSDSNVKSVSSPYEELTVSENGTVAYADITYDVKPDEISDSSIKHLDSSLQIAEQAGFDVTYTGDMSAYELKIGGIAEVIGVALAFVVLTITFGSLVTAGLPIITAILGLLGSLAITFIGTNFFDISAVSLSLTVMIGLAVGIDYALFIAFKHRQQVREGIEIKESIARANGTAGSAVIFAGMTVIVALLSLSVVSIPFLSAMGISAAISVFFAVIISISALPALLSILGNRISPASQKGKNIINKNKNTNMWGKFVTNHPWLTAILSILVLIMLSIPALDMRLGLPDDGMGEEDNPSRVAYDTLSEGFGEGFNGPLVALIESQGEADSEQFNIVNDEISKLDNVDSVTPSIPSENGEYAMVNIIPETGPNDSETSQLVHDIRDLKITDGNNEYSVQVTGMTAINIDIAEKLSEAAPIFAMIIIGFAFVLLMIVFRSLLIPLIAVGGFALSLTATLGATVFILQKGHFLELFGVPATGPILAFLPIMVIGILFGLAMDYQVFLVSRMREEYLHTGKSDESIIAGLKYSGPVVFAAGLIMVFVFAGFIFTEDIMIKSMGIALTFGIIFDAFVVRLALMPALMKVMGPATWYLPKWLDKIIPNIDIEGHRLINEKEELNK